MVMETPNLRRASPRSTKTSLVTEPGVYSPLSRLQVASHRENTTAVGLSPSVNLELDRIFVLRQQVRSCWRQ